MGVKTLSRDFKSIFLRKGGPVTLIGNGSSHEANKMSSNFASLSPFLVLLFPVVEFWESWLVLRMGWWFAEWCFNQKSRWGPFALKDVSATRVASEHHCGEWKSGRCTLTWPAGAAAHSGSAPGQGKRAFPG